MAEDHKETDSIGREEESELSRRELLKLSASAAFAVALTGLDTRAAAESAQSKAPLFFTKEEFALVDELTELIIPADDHSPGARAALVAGYIDFRLSESFEESPKSLWRDGLKLIEKLSQEMHGKSFLASSPEQRIALLTRISINEMKPEKPEELFFRELKSHTAGAYYSSKIGIHTEMEYKGNTYLKEFAGYDAT
jgi:hypothetical protein